MTLYEVKEKRRPFYSADLYSLFADDASQISLFGNFHLLFMNKVENVPDKLKTKSHKSKEDTKPAFDSFYTTIFRL